MCACASAWVSCLDNQKGRVEMLHSINESRMHGLITVGGLAQSSSTPAEKVSLEDAFVSCAPPVTPIHTPN